MDRQEIFNKALAAMRKQRAPGNINGGTRCAYLTEDGRRCAIGHLLAGCLDDEDLAGRMCGVGDLIEDVPRVGPYLGVAEDTDVEFLEALQGAHDEAVITSSQLNVKFLECFEGQMAALARAWGLHGN